MTLLSRLRELFTEFGKKRKLEGGRRCNKIEKRLKKTRNKKHGATAHGRQADTSGQCPLQEKISVFSSLTELI